MLKYSKITLCTTFRSLATVPSHKKLFDKFSRSNYLQLLWKLWQLHLLMPMEKSRCVEMFFFQEYYCSYATVFQARWNSKCTNLIWRYSFSISILCISREILVNEIKHAHLELISIHNGNALREWVSQIRDYYI